MLNPSQTEVFASAVRHVLINWPELNVAIENGMGGADAKAKQDWMCQHIIDVILLNRVPDLEEYLAEIINQEFDTILEDGSLEYNVKWIEKFYKDCSEGREQQVLDSIKQASSMRRNMPLPQNVIQTSDDDEDDDCDDVDDDDY